MKHCLLLFLFLITGFQLLAEDRNSGGIMLVGVENPVYLTISPDGLRMIVIDWPKKGYPVLKQTIRPSAGRDWSGATEIWEINHLLNQETQLSSVTFSYDNKLLFFSGNLPGSRGGLDIYYSAITPDGFAVPVNIGPVINTPGDENYPSVSGNNRALFFTRNIEMNKIKDLHPGELWMSTLSGMSDIWQEPEKINIVINDGAIGYPKIYDDNKTLFYSRADEEDKKWRIHWTKRIGDIHWYLPVKLDTTRRDDHEISPVFCRQDGFLYFISCSDKGSPPKGTIFRKKIEPHLYPDQTIEISGTIRDSVHKTPVEARVLVTNPVLGQIEYNTLSGAKDGKWRTLLPADQMYMFHLWKEGYSHFYQLFNSEETGNGRNLAVDLTPETVLTLNIYDEEELWPLDATVGINSGGQIKSEIKTTELFKGQQKMTLPVGSNFTIHVSKAYYHNNSINLDLSSVVLFDKFVRDIELKPVKREIEILVTGKDTRQPLEASVEVIDQRRKMQIPEQVKGSPGLFKTALRDGEPYDIEVRGPKFFAFRHVLLDLAADKSLRWLNIELDPLTRKVPIRLDNINFELNSADLLSNSFPELNRVVQLMKDNPDIYVEISAHTCDIGSDRFNDVLSGKRAKSVVEYLTLKGIKSERMAARGYGEKNPCVPNDNEGNRAMNRRVELKILDENDEVFQIEEKIKN